jgi:hypothetical protein
MENEISSKRVYIVAKKDTDTGKDFVLGVFSNRKIVYENLKNIGLDGCFIKGARKIKEVSPETISTSFNGRGLTIYKEKDNGECDYIYKILEIRINEINPYFYKREKK